MTGQASAREWVCVDTADGPDAVEIGVLEIPERNIWQTRRLPREQARAFAHDILEVVGDE